MQQDLHAWVSCSHSQTARLGNSCVILYLLLLIKGSLSPLQGGPAGGILKAILMSLREAGSELSPLNPSLKQCLCCLLLSGKESKYMWVESRFYREPEGA